MLDIVNKKFTLTMDKKNISWTGKWEEEEMKIWQHKLLQIT